MLSVYFYNNPKRRNSTALPPASPAPDTLSCSLKDTCSFLNPGLIINYSSVPKWNYFKFEDRYYWITDIVSLKNNLWLISGTIDALATFRSHIKNTQAFVLYDSTANTELPDSRLAIKTTPTVSSNTGVMPWSFSSGNGTHFIAIQGDGELVSNGSANGATGVYITDMSSIQKIGMSWNPNDLLAQLSVAMTTPFPFTLPSPYSSVNTWAEVLDKMLDGLTNSDIAAAIGWGFVALTVSPIMFWSLACSFATAFINGADALKYVKTAYWLPFEFTGVGVQKNKIALGSFVDIIGTSRLVNDPIKDTYAAVTIPWQYSDWRNVQNTEIQLYIPLIGVINIPASAVKGQTVITMKCSINLFSGTFSVRVECGGVTLGTYGANVMMPILVGDSNPDVPAISNTIVAGAALAVGAATGTAALTVGAAAGALQSGLQCIQPVSTSVGGIGGGVGNSLGNEIVCTTICHDTSQSPSALTGTIGTPTNQLKTLSGTGYCQTMNAQLNCTAQTGEPNPTDTEIQLVNTALNTGVYLE